MSSKIRAKKHIDILDKIYYFIPDIYTYLLCTIRNFYGFDLGLGFISGL